MMDPLDVELQKTDDEGPRPMPRRREPLIWTAAAVLVAAGAAAYVWLNRPEPGVAATEVVVTQRPAPADVAVGREQPAIDVPPLDQSDPLVRSLLAAVSSHPRVAAWMATPNLIRNFTVVVENIAGGTTPARHLKVLAPAGPFRVLTRDDEVRVDPRSYARYDGIAAAVASIDAADAAGLYATLRVRMDDAYRELGHEGPFDVALERAIVSLLRTPLIDADVALVPSGALYVYDDAQLQGLSAPQKQLLRMGPRNATIVQGKLREIALAIGIPARRLPAPTT
jgi:Protein of unknown function (DUF3014)